MKTSTNRALSLLTAVLLLTALALPSVALALEPGQIEVTISAEPTVTASKAEATGSGTYTGTDGATIIPDEEDNGYTYNNTYQQSTDVSLQGSQEDLTIVKGTQGPVLSAVAPPEEGGGTTDTIPNKVVTGADRTGYEDGDPALNELHDNNTYLDEYTAPGTSASTSSEAFPGTAVDQWLVNDILASNGIQPEDGKDYFVEVGATTITGDKTVQEVTVTDADGNAVGYEVTLTAEGNRTDKVFDSEGGINISGKTNVVLTIDITDSMARNLVGNDITNGELNDDSRWAILKQAATAFIDTIYGVQRDSGGNITNRDDLNEHIGLSLVIYSGSTNSDSPSQPNYVARTVTVGSTSNIVFTKDDIGDLLGFFAEDAKRSDLPGAPEIMGNRTNTQAGYIETKDVVDALLTPSYGVSSASNIHVVFMTDGEANSHYDDKNDKTSTESATNAVAGKDAADAAVELLKKGVSLHNVAINNSDTTIKQYMDPNATGYFKDELADAGFVNSPSAKYSLYNINYTWANEADQIIETYRTIAENIVNDTIVAKEARVIDVVPKGYDIFFENGNTDLKVVGLDGEGNTIIEWYIGNLKNGIQESTRYFLLPNSDMGDKYTFGTAYTNDSAILFAKPTAQQGEEIAIVLDRPAIVLNPFADNDTVTEQFNNSGFGFNIISGGNTGASAGSAYNLLVDSRNATKLQAVDTTVSDTSVKAVRNATIGGVAATVNPDGTGWKFENGQLRIKIAADGTVTYERLGAWPAAWGSDVGIYFEYDIGFTADGHGMRQLIGEPDTASANVSVKLTAPGNPPPDDDDDDDDDDIPLNPGNPDDGQFANIPLGVPQTGGAAVYPAQALVSLAGFAAYMLLKKRRNG